MRVESGRAHLARHAAYVSARRAARRRLRADARRLQLRTTIRPRLAGQPRGATVAFESIDGLPPGQFHELVQALNDEAQTRQLAVMSRESPSAYRVRGYLAAKVVKRETTISWVWDVFDARRPSRAAHHRRGDRQRCATATPGPPPTMPCCAGSPAAAWTSSPPS